MQVFYERYEGPDDDDDKPTSSGDTPQKGTGEKPIPVVIPPTKPYTGPGGF